MRFWRSSYCAKRRISWHSRGRLTQSVAVGLPQRIANYSRCGLRRHRTLSPARPQPALRHQSTCSTTVPTDLSAQRIQPMARRTSRQHFRRLWMPLQSRGMVHAPAGYCVLVFTDRPPWSDTGRIVWLCAVIHTCLQQSMMAQCCLLVRVAAIRIRSTFH